MANELCIWSRPPIRTRSGTVSAPTRGRWLACCGLARSNPGPYGSTAATATRRASWAFAGRPAPNRWPSRPLHGDQVVGQRLWPGQGDEVTAGQHIRLQAQPLAGHLALELDREEPVIRAGHDPDRDRRPAAEVAHRSEDRFCLRTLVRLARG